MRYIEAIHRDYAAQLESARQDLEYERGQRSQVEEQGSLASEEAVAAGKDAQRAKEELVKVREELEEVLRQREDLRLRLKATQEELATLQAAAERMAPAAKAYESLKEKAAGIELDAHHRAQAIVKAGEAEAEQAREKVRQWLRQVESSYGRLRSDVAATLAHAGAELERTVKSLDSVTAELESHAQDLKGIAGEVKPATAAPKSEPVNTEQAKAEPAKDEKKFPFRK